MTKLGDVCTKIGSGATPRGGKEAYRPAGTPIIRSQNVLDWSFSEAGLAFIDAKQAAALANAEVRPGDVLLNITGDSVARACMVPLSQTPARVNQHVSILRAGEKIDSMYLLCFIQSQKAHLLKLASSGATRNALTKGMLEALEIELPALSQQRAIASVVAAIQARIALNNQINGYLAEYLKSCAKRLYREYERDEEADLPEGWHWTTIGEISEMVCRGITPKYNDESDELILGQTCIRNNLVLLENGRLHAPRKISEKWLKKYDLLINSTGVGSLGRTAQVWFDPSKLVVDSHVTTVRAADPRYALYMGFWAFEHERYIESLHTGSTGQTELPRDHVKAIRLVLPGDAELDKFNAVAQPAVELIVANQKESKRLAELRDTLLPKLMSGEMDVSSVAI